MDCLVVSYLRDWNVLNLTWAVAIERRATVRGPCSVTGRSFAARLQRHRARLRGWRGGSSLTVPALLRLVPSSSTSSSSSSSSLSHKMRVVVSMGTRMASEKKRERQSKAGVSSPSFFNRRERARESGNTCFYYNGRKAAAAATGSDDNDQPRVVSRDKVRLFSKSIYVNWN